MIKTIVKQLLCIALIGAFFMPASSAAAAPGLQESSGITLTANAGFDGWYKSEYWMPIHINIANNGPAVEAIIRIPKTASTTTSPVYYETPVSLPTQSNKNIETYVKIDAILRSLTVQLLDENDNVLLETKTANNIRRVDDFDLIYGVVSSEPDELSFLENVTAGRSNAQIAALDFDDLPASTVAWHTLDLLVINDVDSGKLKAEQLEAMNQWIDGGGQLIVTGGTNWQQTSAAFADLLPVSINGIQTVDDLPALSSFAALPFRDPGPYTLADSSLRNGELLLHQDGLPLLAKSDVGRGDVYYLAADPQLAPLVDWDGSEKLWELIAGNAPQLPFWAFGPSNPYAAYEAVESLPSLSLPSILQLALFLGGYVLLIGPLNYIFLKRRGRREWAWLTIPALIALFTVAAYLIGFQVKGNDVIVNQMNIAYGWANSEMMRVKSVIGVYSPRRNTFDLSAPADVMIHPSDREYGSSLTNGSGEIVRGQEVTIKEMRVDVGGVETVVAQSIAPMPAISTQAKLIFDGNNPELEVNIKNNNDFEMENAVILIGSRSYLVGDLKSGESYVDSLRLSRSAISSSASYSSYGGTNPLSSHYNKLLEGSSTSSGYYSYYDDPELYPRWQLLESMSTEYGAPRVFVPAGAITLIFWGDQRQLNVELNRDDYVQLGETLYFIELPYEEQNAPNANVIVPPSMLTVTTLDSNYGYEVTSPFNSYLNGWAEFEYVPWNSYSNMDVKEFAVYVDLDNAADKIQIRIWDWENEDWATLSDSVAGTNIIPDFAPYLNENNAVRLRLQSDSSSGVGITAIYPVLEGELE